PSNGPRVAAAPGVRGARDGPTRRQKGMVSASTRGGAWAWRLRGGEGDCAAHGWGAVPRGGHRAAAPGGAGSLACRGGPGAGGRSLGTPLRTGHDEGDQAVRSAAAARGEVLGNPVPGWHNGLVEVHVPEAYAKVDAIGGCFIGRPYAKFPGAPTAPPGRGPCP